MQIWDKHIVNQNSLAGVGATLIGVGIGRFAYIALIPALIQSGWFSESDVSYLGVATLIGYIAGAPAVNMLLKFVSIGQLIRGTMLISSLSYFSCAWQEAPLTWLYVWRTLAGVAGAVLMVAAPPVIMRSFDAKVKARVSGVVFSGIGLGAMLSGTLIPLLVYMSITSAWLGMGMIVLVTTVLTWDRWGEQTPLTSAPYVNTSFSLLSRTQRINVTLVLVAYGLCAIGYLPHTLFWVDFIVRELEMSLMSGGLFWATFGVGAAIGPMLTGTMGDSLGTKRSLCIAFGLKAFAVVLPFISTQPAPLFISSLLVGIFTPGIVTLVSTYTLECVGYELHTKAWSAMTLSFAVAQGIGGLVMAYFISQMTSYLPLFIFSSCALVLAFICVFYTSPTSIQRYPARSV